MKQCLSRSTFLKRSFLAVFLLLLAGCRSSAPPSSPSSEAVLHPAADNIAVRWGVETNYLDGRFRSTLTLENHGAVPLGSMGWTLYFNFARTILPESLPSSVQITRVNGQFWELRPTPAFAPLSPGEKRPITFEAGAWAIKENDAPSGFYFVFEGKDGPKSPALVGSEAVEPFTEARQMDRGQNDAVPVPTPERRHRVNSALSPLPDAQVGRITPTPISLKRKAGTVTLDDALTVRYANGLKREAAYLAAALKPLLGERPALMADTTTSPKSIVLRRGDVSPPGDSDAAYKLTVDSQRGIQITGASRKGVFYGLQSLRALIPPPAHEQPSEAITLGAVSVRDAPRFEYRGLHLDVARNFQTKDAVKKLLDLMALYKLNTFHFHLTDDEGWRLPIEELPELTEVGGRRGHPVEERREHLLPSFGSGPDPDTTASHGSGFYSRSDFKDLLRYARERHITVVPEIDVPGHARAAIVAMEARHDRLMDAGRPEAARRYRLQDAEDQSEYRSVQGWSNNVVNACRPSTYRFLETVVDDLQEMYDEANVPLGTVHVGGDEVPAGAWEHSPACQQLFQQSDSLGSADQLQQYFFKRLYRILKERDLTMAGWQEIAFAEQHLADSTTVTAADPHFAERRVRTYVWHNGGIGDTDNAYKLANAGYDEVVMSHASSLYFDMAYTKHPQEAGSYWAGFTDTKKPFAFAPFAVYASIEQSAMGHPIADTAFASAEPLTKEGRANILGLQGQLWSETLQGQKRLEHMAVPRLLALAERAWAAQPKWATIEDEAKRERRLNVAWSEFANRLGQRELPRLDYLAGGAAYRLPPPGAVIEDKLLKASTAYPGLQIRYTTDGTAPTTQSPRYVEPVHVEGGPVKLRSFSTNGRGSRVVTVALSTP